VKPFTLFLILVFSLCVHACYYVQQSPKQNGKPDWFWRPNVEGKIGGVGVAGPHINGIGAQRELAISRAIEDISRQMGVTVSSVSRTGTAGSKDGALTQMETYSIQTVTGQTVRAKIREFWQEPETQKLYVWMVVE